MRHLAISRIIATTIPSQVHQIESKGVRGTDLARQCCVGPRNAPEGTHLSFSVKIARAVQGSVSSMSLSLFTGDVFLYDARHFVESFRVLEVAVSDNVC